MLFIALSLLLMPRYGCDKFPSALPWVSLCDPSLPHETLLVRAREISSAYNSAISDNFLTSYGPNLMLGIITFGTKNIFDYAAYSFAINAAFAQYNNYYFRFIEEGEFNNGERIDDVRWSKVKILLEALDPNSGWARDFDYLVWIDSDLVFLDFKLRLELVADLQRADIVASAEHAGSSTLINSGCLLVRNSQWARRFLQDWWGHADRSLFSDQEQFDLLYEQRRRRDGTAFTQRVAILAPDALNSDPPAMTQQREHSQVLHLMGEETAYRARVFKAGLREVCRAALASGSDPSAENSGTLMIAEGELAAQLTLTQPNLLLWAADSYAAESTLLMKQYEASLPAPALAGTVGAAVQPQGLESSRRMANVAHHFAHALLHQQQHQHEECGAAAVALPDHTTGCKDRTEQGGVQPSTGGDHYRRAVTLRKKVYQLLRRNLVAWRALQGEGVVAGPISFAAIRADWPELLKVTSIAGQHLLSVVAGDVVSEAEKRAVAGEILTMMQEMLRNSHEQQHDAILLMVADIHQQIGVLDLAQSYQQGSVEAADEGKVEVRSVGDGEAVRADFVRAALHHFQLSLDVTSSVAEKAGAHLLIAPLVLTANALASLGDFRAAFEKYERAIALNQGHLGALHESNVPLLVDFGISLLHGGECDRASQTFERVGALLGDPGTRIASSVQQRVVEYRNRIEIKCGF